HPAVRSTASARRDKNSVSSSPSRTSAAAEGGSEQAGDLAEILDPLVAGSRASESSAPLLPAAQTPSQIARPPARLSTVCSSAIPRSAHLPLTPPAATPAWPAAPASARTESPWPPKFPS